MWEIYYSNDGQADPWHANRISREDKQESVVIVGTHGWLRFLPLSISSAEWLLLKTIWSGSMSIFVQSERSFQSTFVSFIRVHGIKSDRLVPCRWSQARHAKLTYFLAERQEIKGRQSSLLNYGTTYNLSFWLIIINYGTTYNLSFWYHTTKYISLLNYALHMLWYVKTTQK